MEVLAPLALNQVSVASYGFKRRRSLLGDMAGAETEHWQEGARSGEFEPALHTWCLGRSRESSRRGSSPQAAPNMRSNGPRSYRTASALAHGLLALMWFLISPANSVFINFQNCLSQSYINGPTLQFVPLFMDAAFNTTDPSHNLRVTVWGNVTGAFYKVQLPLPNDLAWRNSTITDGKIENLTAPYDHFTTLSKKTNVLTYEPWKHNDNFCQQLVNGSCPLAPTFKQNPILPYDLPSFSMTNDFYSSYAFASLTATFLIINGDVLATNLGCISAEITPDLGNEISALLAYLPLVVLISVGFATALAGVYSPWGSLDIFKWTSNYGRDADLLRLVTPGFGDCLLYIQFIVLTGGLTLSYPGFYQPVVSKVSWSTLMFNESFVSQGGGSQSLIDGIYFTNGTYGLDNLGQLVGMANVDDIWAGMAVWLLVIVGSVMALIQLGFLLRWVYRHITDDQEEDLRAKNMPFSVGNAIRIVFSYFLLPIVALSMFQLVVAASSPAYTVALAVVLLLTVVGFAGWLLYVIASTRPRSFLFDDLPTVLLYGSLYNTYSDDAATFALVPVLLTFVRGVAIGAVQPSGIAQIVLLAICEIITILTLHSFRPFHSPTSMNAYHTLFAVARLLSILLMVAFAPSLGVTDGPKGWIGYAILLLHCIVLVFGFLLNALQTIVEVLARLAGAGGDESGATRGGLVKAFGMRQLSRRLPRGGAVSRQSELSTTAILDQERKSGNMNDRERTQSAGSVAVLLTRPRSVGVESSGIDMASGGAHTPTTPGEASTFSFVPTAVAQAGANRAHAEVFTLSSTEAADPYYRPPRARRPTLEAAHSPAARSRGSWASGDGANQRWSNQAPSQHTPFEETAEPLGPSISGRGTPIPAFLAGQQQPAELQALETRLSQPDYTTREVDFYYGVRGPALNANHPNRRLKTGPVDPTGPASSAVGWFNRLLGGKTKDKGKGFEVVRSSRMPPGMNRSEAGGDSPPEDVPEGIPAATHGEVRSGPIDSDDDEPTPRKKRIKNEKLISVRDESELGSEAEGDDENFEMTRISDIPPSLPGLDIGDGIDFPSRLPSHASSSRAMDRSMRVPTLPRKNPRRTSQGTGIARVEMQDHATVGLYDPDPHTLPQTGHSPRESARLPFDRSNSKRHSTASARSSIAPLEDVGQGNQLSMIDDSPTSVGHVSHHSTWTVTAQTPGIDLFGSSAEIVNERPSVSSRHSYENWQR